MSGKMMTIYLKIWRQKNSKTKGAMEEHKLTTVSPDMSFLEMIDVLNEGLVRSGKEPIAFEHDCREGICGACSMVINGSPHGPEKGTTTCQLHMRKFNDGDIINVEPFRAKAFPVIKDLVVDRSAFDRIIEEGGYTSIKAGNPQDANAILIPKENADLAMDAAACIGCGACVAVCKNASPMLFVSAKISHLALLPQGQPERAARALSMVEAMDREGFGNCTNTLACEAVCPKEISVENIARMNRDFSCANVTTRS